MVDTRIRQAVVLIHGIGEQRPMDTLKKFVSAVLGPQHHYTHGQDNSMYALDTLFTLGNPITTFFEFYWAYQVKWTRFRHIVRWITIILFRHPDEVPRHLLLMWWFSWFLIALVFVGVTVTMTSRLAELMLQVPNFVIVVQAPSFVIAAIGALFLLSVHGIVINYLGDAARYFDNHPQNVELQESIREKAVNLLRKIHDSKEYDRVIVVGHSLGSVIAYDVVRFLWAKDRYNLVHTRPSLPQPALDEIERVAPILDKGSQGVTVGEYQEKQDILWHEYRSMGSPWLVTDLITLGSPLAHAALLYGGDLRARQRERELPRNPPEPFTVGIGEFEWHTYGLNMQGTPFKVLYSDALFACTRWTNLFFPARLGVFGDFVGGPLQDVFGRGIRDQAVTTRGFLRRNSPVAHTSYWYTERQTTYAYPIRTTDVLWAARPTRRDEEIRTRAGEASQTPLALEALIEALDLDCTRSEASWSIGRPLRNGI
jgi:glycosyltransferase involved in cell wall biosynthesis